MKKLLFVSIMGLTMFGHQAVASSPQCQSQLVRIEVSNEVFQASTGTLLPILHKFAERPELSQLLERSYHIPEIPFPQNTRLCQEQKDSGNSDYASIACDARALCNRTDLPESVRERICFNIPCPILEGPLQTGKCLSENKLFPTTISFPGPMTLKKIRLVPKKSEIKDQNFRLCFSIEELELSASVGLTFDTTKTQLQDRTLTLSQLTPRLDGARAACLSGSIDLRSRHPFSKLSIETEPGKPFISDAMLYQVASTATISGLSGYLETDVNKIKREVLPVLFAAFRHIVEDAVKASLADVIRDELNDFLSDEKKPIAQDISTQNLVNEISVGSLSFQRYLYQTECSALFEARKPIPASHECRRLKDFREDSSLGPFRGTYWELRDILKEGLRLNVTSERVRQRLVDLKASLLERVNTSQEYLRQQGHKIEDDGSYRRYAEKDYQTYVEPVLEKITENQTNLDVAEEIRIKDLQQGRQGREIGLSLPDTCDPRTPSAHARRSMPNCPVQAYVDLKEVNKLFDLMWQEGMLCQEGKGPFVPGSPRYDAKRKGRPTGTGCAFEVNAMKCFIGSAPRLSWSETTKQYGLRLQLKECFYPGVAGLGDLFKFGGDLTIDVAFVPKICDGDICIRNPNIRVRQVPKTGRFSLDQTDGIPNKDILDMLRKGIRSGVSDALRIPLTSSLQSLANLPLEATGRLDMGRDYVGVCLGPNNP